MMAKKQIENLSKNGKTFVGLPICSISDFGTKLFKYPPDPRLCKEAVVISNICVYICEVFEFDFKDI